jgi:hypothetical protein
MGPNKKIAWTKYNVCACVCVLTGFLWQRKSWWQALLYVVVNCRISYNVWKLLAASGIFSFTRISVLQRSSYLRCWYSKYKRKKKARDLHTFAKQNQYLYQVSCW